MNESRRAVAHVPGVRVYCTGCGAVRGASVSSCVLLCVFCGWGAAEGLTQKHRCLLTLRGGSPQSPHQPLCPTSWAPVQKESRTVRPISFAFRGVQQTVGCQSTARHRGSRGGRLFSAPARASPRLIFSPALLASRPPSRWS